MAVKHLVRAAACFAVLSAPLSAPAFLEARAADAAPRFAPLPADSLTPAQKDILLIKRSLAAGKYNPNGLDAVYARNVGVQDAINTWAGEAYAAVGNSLTPGLTDKPTVSPALVEIAILMLSRTWEFPPMFTSHGPTAVKLGVSQDTVDAIAQGKHPAKMKADEEAVYDFCTELFAKRAVSDATFEKLRKHLSERDVVDLVTTLGIYTNSIMMVKVANIASH